MKLSIAAAALFLLAVVVSAEADDTVRSLRGTESSPTSANVDNNSLPEKFAQDVYAADTIATVDPLHPAMHASHHDSSRSLMENVMDHSSDHSASFQPLPCNDVFHAASPPTCALWSDVFSPTVISGLTGPAKIDCGTCVKIDGSVTGPVSVPTGINIEGKLLIDSADHGAASGVEITTPFVLVQGILEINSDRPVSPTDGTELIRFVLDDTTTGGANLNITDQVHMHNSMFCSMHKCTVGTKPIVVAGGKLNIHALPSSCPSWTRLHDVETRLVTIPDVGTYPSPAQLSQNQTAAACPSQNDTTLAGIVIDARFDSDSELGYAQGEFNGHWATYSRDTIDSHTPNDPYLRVTDRGGSWQGPMIHVDNIIKCMVPNEPYVLSAKVKLQPTDAFIPETETNTTKCSAIGQSCVEGVLYGQRTDESKFWRGLNNRGTDIDAIEDGEWYDYTTIYSFTKDDLAEGITHRLYFEGPEPGVDILFDDVRLAPVPPELYPEYANQGQDLVCTELTMNSGADEGGSLAYPFYANANIDIKQEDVGGGNINSYFRNDQRSAAWHGLQYKLTPSCVTEGDIYAFSAKIRVDTGIDQPVKAAIMLKSTITQDANSQWKTVKLCPLQTSEDGWVECTADWTFDEHQASSDVVEMYFELWAINEEGDTVIMDHSNTAAIDFDDVSVSFVSGPVDALLVASEVFPCWGNGSEVLVTSHTIKYDEHNIRTIVSEPTADPTITRLVLDSPVPSTVTTQVHEDANPTTVRAVEVALLSRNAIFTASTIEGDKKSGGHFMIFHTPEAQFVEGLEIRKFGQAGNLGRYPLHFHMCGNSEGSIVSKNLVRESFQRCYVLHGSHNVTISSSVAYDTFGHCFFLEDGAEMDNTMEYNLGAMTKNQPEVDVISSDESDDTCATFWLTNPVNSWEGNVAAGSESSGFWFEMREHVRGPSQQLLPEMRPKYLPLQYFNNNVAHSNNEHGLKTYPGAGYAPSESQAEFQNMQSFRNRGDGVFFHNSRNLALVGGFVSDNRRQVDFDRVTTTRVSDATITGYSPLYKSVVSSEGNNWYHRHCPSDHPLVGVQLHTYWSGEGDARGFVVENTSFAHLGAATTCEGSHAINVDNYENRGYFDIRSSLSGLSFDSNTEPFEVCSAKYEGVGDIDMVAIHDLDGSTMGEVGFILSGSPRMTSLLEDNACSPMTDTCAVKCPGICIRSKYYKVSSLMSDALSLHVVDIIADKTVDVSSYFDIDVVRMEEENPELDDDKRTHQHRTFHVALPENGGPYEASFVENGEVVWPTYVEEVVDDVPGNCGSVDPVVTFIQPPVPEGFCDELIVNGNISDGDDGWLHNDGGISLHDEGVDGVGDQAIKSDSRTASWHGLAQFLDTRCLVQGDVYEFAAQVKTVRESDGLDPGCDAFAGDGGCPKIYLQYKVGPNYPDDDRWIGISTGATTTGQWTIGEWNTFKGTLTITQEMAENAESALIYFNGPPAGINMIVDNVSFAPYVAEPIVCSDVILYEDFTESKEGWDGNGNSGGYSLATADSHTEGDQYFWVQGRVDSWHGPLIDMDIGCMTPGLHFLTAKIKLHRTASFTGEASNCELDNEGCVQSVYYRSDSSDQAYWRVPTTVLPVSTVDDVWFEFAAYYEFTEDDLTPGNAHRLYFEGPEANIDIMIDDVVLTRAPPELSPTEPSCDDLVVNGNAEIAPPFTQPATTNAWKTKLIVEEETVDGETNHYFSIKDRWGYWHGLQYYLPPLCVNTGEKYFFNAKIRIHSTTSSHAKIIMFSQTDPNVDADKSWQTLVNCQAQTILDGWVDCAMIYTITSHQGNADLVQFYVEVPEDINAVVDHDGLSFTPYVKEPVVCSDIILYEGFSDALSRSIWNGNGNSGGNVLATTDSHTDGDQYFWVKGRTGSWNGPLIDLDIGCMRPGLHFLTAKIKLHRTASFTGEASNCELNDEGCLGAVYYRRDSSDQPYWKGPTTVLPVSTFDEEWFEFAAYYEFTEEDLTQGTVHRLYFDGPEANLDVMIDDVVLTRAPSELSSPPDTCNELMANGNAEIAPPFTQPLTTNAWKTKLIVEEETVDGEINHYFSIKDRYGGWHGAQYYLSPSCVNAGEQYTLLVKIRIHSTTESHAKFVMFSQTDPNVNADKSWSLLGHCYPLQTIDDGWVDCVLPYSFTAHQGNAGLIKFYIEVPEDINAVVDYDDFSFAPSV